jgi:hypothetical protein
VLAILDGLGTIIALVATFLEHRSIVDPYGEPPFTTPLRERYGQPLDSEWLPLADEAPALTMWDEAIGTATSRSGPTELASAAFGDDVLAGLPVAAAAVDPATHRVWTQSWQAGGMDAESDFQAELEAVTDPVAEPEVAFDPELGPELDQVPAAPTPAPNGNRTGSAPILHNGSTVLLSADVEWRLLESSRKFGMTPDEIVRAALDGINELDDED